MKKPIWDPIFSLCTKVTALLCSFLCVLFLVPWYKSLLDWPWKQLGTWYLLAQHPGRAWRRCWGPPGRHTGVKSEKRGITTVKFLSRHKSLQLDTECTGLLFAGQFLQTCWVFFCLIWRSLGLFLASISALFLFVFPAPALRPWFLNRSTAMERVC